jgi:murein DD-endopeptidase MepM/ murein hydrolase activator NlpD
MPTESVRGWWHLTAAVNMRSAPNGAAKYVIKVQKVGHNFWAVAEIQADGRAWLKTNLGHYYAKQYAVKGRRKAPAPPARPASPVPGHAMGYPFGVRDSHYKAGYHTGADWPASTGDPIVALVSGKVVRADWGGAYGNWTLIMGSDGHVWLYAHQSRREVRVGQKVVRGQVIGYVGTTGNVTGPHVHIELSKGRNWAYGSVQKPRW